MSFQAMNWCAGLHHVLGPRRAVLWALANRHNRETGLISMGVRAIALESGLTKSVVQRLLVQLDRDGLAVCVLRGAGHRPSVYILPPLMSPEAAAEVLASQAVASHLNGTQDGPAASVPPSGTPADQPLPVSVPPSRDARSAADTASVPPERDATPVDNLSKETFSVPVASGLTELASHSQDLASQHHAPDQGNSVATINTKKLNHYARAREGSGSAAAAAVAASVPPGEGGGIRSSEGSGGHASLVRAALDAARKKPGAALSAALAEALRPSVPPGVGP